MKNKIKRCPICLESIYSKNRKIHLLSYHLEENLDLVVYLLINAFFHYLL